MLFSPPIPAPVGPVSMYRLAWDFPMPTTMPSPAPSRTTPSLRLFVSPSLPPAAHPVPHKTESSRVPEIVKIAVLGPCPMPKTPQNTALLKNPPVKATRCGKTHQRPSRPHPSTASPLPAFISAFHFSLFAVAFPPLPAPLCFPPHSQPGAGRPGTQFPQPCVAPAGSAGATPAPPGRRRICRFRGGPRFDRRCRRHAHHQRPRRSEHVSSADHPCHAARRCLPALAHR